MQRATEALLEPVKTAPLRGTSKKMNASQAKLQRSKDAAKKAPLSKLQQTKEVPQSVREEETRETAEFVMEVKNETLTGFEWQANHAADQVPKGKDMKEKERQQGNELTEVTEQAVEAASEIRIYRA